MAFLEPVHCCPLMSGVERLSSSELLLTEALIQGSFFAVPFGPRTAAGSSTFEQARHHQSMRSSTTKSPSCLTTSWLELGLPSWLCPLHCSWRWLGSLCGQPGDLMWKRASAWLCNDKQLLYDDIVRQNGTWPPVRMHCRGYPRLPKITLGQVPRLHPRLAGQARMVGGLIDFGIVPSI